MLKKIKGISATNDLEYFITRRIQSPISHLGSLNIDFKIIKTDKNILLYINYDEPNSNDKYTALRKFLSELKKRITGYHVFV